MYKSGSKLSSIANFQKNFIFSSSSAILWKIAPSLRKSGELATEMILIHGIKEYKERLTILFAVSSSIGKQASLIVGKSSYPRCLKGNCLIKLISLLIDGVVYFYKIAEVLLC